MAGVAMEGLEPVEDVGAAAWIAPRLAGFGGHVGQVVPSGFPAYARVLHRAADEEGRPVTWAQVCERTGARPHALMQWRAIAPGWEGYEPQQGRLDGHALETLLAVLSRFTGPDEDCFHALWEGWAWVSGRGVALLAHDRLGGWAQVPAHAGVPEQTRLLPRLELPHRRYLLFRGPLAAAARMGYQPSATWFDPQSPSLLWPAGRQWCVATEVDFDSTLVAGPTGLVAALLDETGLETWQVHPEDDLSWGGDVVNA